MTSTVLALGLGTLFLPAVQQLDEVPLALRARATRVVAAEANTSPPAPAGNQLFFRTAPDNAPCVRAVADVTGDGLDEVIAGIDESGVPNVYALSGASTGLATDVWSYQTADGVSGGSPYGDQSIVPISDTDGNGAQNILVGTAWGGRTAYNLDAQTGAVSWRFDTYLEPQSGWVYSLAEMQDTTGDGIPEVAFGAGSMNDTLYYVDGSAQPGQAAVLWVYPAGDAVYSVRNAGDVNGDAVDDVLAAIGDNVDRLVCLDGASPGPGTNVFWIYQPGITVYACGVLPDVTGDGVSEALVALWASDGSSIRCVNGATGVLLWSSTTVFEPGMMVDVIDDVDGDGFDDVVVGSWENAAQVLSGLDGTQVWKVPVGTVNGGDVWTVAAIDDLNGDGFQDVIAGSFDLHAYAFSGVDGTMFWCFDTGNRVYSVAPVGDLNGDGRPEVAVGTQDTSNNLVVHVLEGDAGITPPTTSYCTGKTNSLGCVPFLSSVGAPSATSTTPFRIVANDLVPNEAGFYLYGSQKANLNFHGGKLCVKAPFTRLLPPKGAGNAGTPPCAGVVKRDFNVLIQSGSDPSLSIGATVRSQFRQRDPADPAGFGDGLTDGLLFTIAP